MIKYYKGDLLKSDCDMFCHQVNYFGAMDAGIALQIKNQFPNTYERYNEYCKSINNKTSLLGSIYVVKENDKYIVNLFGQRDWKTSYTHLKQAIIKTYLFAKENNLKVGFPKNIGCGLACGDWNIVYDIIKFYFEGNDVECEIWEYN